MPPGRRRAAARAAQPRICSQPASFHLPPGLRSPAPGPRHPSSTDSVAALKEHWPPRRPPQAGSSGQAPRRLDNAPLQGRTRRSESGRPWTPVGPAPHRSVPPPGAGAQDRHDPGRHSRSAPPPIGCRRHVNPSLPPDELGETQRSLSSRPP
ncbi:hypothetical protein NDU88_002968 [Pleurodeles waltl]|uniref:Uncharacterized protein n=1 Tax=Pleurodeles waltl TaxID=8319 RepID=A0AAV7LH77_PLEWA|nr:hypothetical protein NDU88_002968 [Pleurodeles waltl]